MNDQNQKELNRLVAAYDKDCTGGMSMSAGHAAWEALVRFVDSLVEAARAIPAQPESSPHNICRKIEIDLREYITKLEAKAAALAEQAQGQQVGVTMPEDITKDDALWRAGCKAFRLALNETTGCDGYVVKKTYEALRSHILAAPSIAQDGQKSEGV